jgi:hypothetical protein
LAQYSHARPIDGIVSLSEKPSMSKTLFALALTAMATLAAGQPARAADVICYNSPPEWADWASMLKAIKADLGYDLPYDDDLPRPQPRGRSRSR